MNIGIMLGSTPDPEASLDKFVSVALDVEARGFSSLWLAHIRGHDAIIAMGLAARETTALEVGTAVTPIQPRHPTALAQETLTAQAMARGRFTLGVGLSHQVVIEDMLGLSYARPAQTMREYLKVLRPLLNGQESHYEGELYQVNFGLSVNDAIKPVPVIIAALGPMMLQVAGAFSDGTCLWMTGPKTIASHVVPRLNEAAELVGNPSRRVVAGFPVLLTNDEKKGRAVIASQLARYGQLPSYRAMLDRESLSGPSDIALVGGENVIKQQIETIREAGATDFIAALIETGDGSSTRTLDFLTELNA